MVTQTPKNISIQVWQLVSLNLSTNHGIVNVITTQWVSPHYHQFCIIYNFLKLQYHKHTNPISYLMLILSCIADNLYTSNWLSMNTLNIDEERIIVYSKETGMIDFLKKLGMKPIPVDFTDCLVFVGAFHCWTVDTQTGEIISIGSA